MFKQLRLIPFALAVTFVAPAASSAQGPDATAPAASDAPYVAPATLAGPSLAASAIAVRAPADSSDVTSMQRRAGGAGKPVALMIVGGAAIVLGAVIGDEAGTLFMIGGAVALLYGLYHYLQ